LIVRSLPLTLDLREKVPASLNLMVS